MSHYNDRVLHLPSLLSHICVSEHLLNELATRRGEEARALFKVVAARLDLSAISAKPSEVISHTVIFPRVLGRTWVVKTSGMDYGDRGMFIGPQDPHDYTAPLHRVKQTKLAPETNAVTFVLKKDVRGCWWILDFALGDKLMLSPTHPEVLQMDSVEAGAVLDFWMHHALVYDDRMGATRQLSWYDAIWEIIWNRSETSEDRDACDSRVHEIISARDAIVWRRSEVRDSLHLVVGNEGHNDPALNDQAQAVAI